MGDTKTDDFGVILAERCKVFLVIVIFLLMDCTFLLFWVALHWIIPKAIERFSPVGNENLLIICLRIILELPILMFILLFVAVDTKRVAVRIIHGARKNSGQEFKSIDSHNAKNLANSP